MYEHPEYIYLSRYIKRSTCNYIVILNALQSIVPCAEGDLILTYRLLSFFCPSSSFHSTHFFCLWINNDKVSLVFTWSTNPLLQLGLSVQNSQPVLRGHLFPAFEGYSKEASTQFQCSICWKKARIELWVRAGFHLRVLLFKRIKKGFSQSLMVLCLLSYYKRPLWRTKEQGSSCDGVIAFCRFLQNPVSLGIPVVNVSEMMHHRVCDSVK